MRCIAWLMISGVQRTRFGPVGVAQPEACTGAAEARPASTSIAATAVTMIAIRCIMFRPWPIGAPVACAGCWCAGPSHSAPARMARDASTVKVACTVEPPYTEGSALTDRTSWRTVSAGVPRGRIARQMHKQADEHPVQALLAVRVRAVAHRHDRNRHAVAAMNQQCDLVIDASGPRTPSTFEVDRPSGHGHPSDPPSLGGDDRGQLRKRVAAMTRGDVRVDVQEEQCLVIGGR